MATQSDQHTDNSRNTGCCRHSNTEVSILLGVSIRGVVPGVCAVTDVTPVLYCQCPENWTPFRQYSKYLGRVHEMQTLSRMSLAGI